MEARENTLVVPLALPDWLRRLARRLMHLPPGRYQITLTVSDRPDWSVLYVGKVETPHCG